MSQSHEPSPISRREGLKRAASVLALGLGAPVSLAATSETGTLRLSFYKRGEERPFHSMRLSERDARAINSEALAYIKFDGVDGELTERRLIFNGKDWP